MNIPNSVLAAAIALVGSVALAQPPAPEAQLPPASAPRQDRQQQEIQAPGLGRAESDATGPLIAAVRARDWAAAAAALPAARAGVQSPAGRYLVGRQMLEIGRGQQSEAMQSQAVDAMLESGGAPIEAIPQLLEDQAGFARRSGNLRVEEDALIRLGQYSSNDPAGRLIRLAQIEFQSNRPGAAFRTYMQALESSETGNRHAPQQMYREAIGFASSNRMWAEAFDVSLALVAHYPAPENWRTALGLYRYFGGTEPADDLDFHRLERAVGTLGDEADLLRYAAEADRFGLPGEVKSVLEEGFSRNLFHNRAELARTMLLTATGQIARDRASLADLRAQALAAAEGRVARAAGDRLLGYGEYVEAAELYRVALRKGGEDEAAVNLRLGEALALAGRPAEAEMAFQAVDGAGARAHLRQLWLTWLSTSAR